MADSDKLVNQPDSVNEHFYVVYRVESPNPQRRFTVPARKWATYERARSEAVRLSEQHVGVTFAVMETRSAHRAKGVRKRVKQVIKP